MRVETKLDPACKYGSGYGTRKPPGFSRYQGQTVEQAPRAGQLRWAKEVGVLVARRATMLAALAAESDPRANAILFRCGRPAAIDATRRAAHNVVARGRIVGL